jgi:hypothetical protein
VHGAARLRRWLALAVTDTAARLDNPDSEVLAPPDSDGADLGAVGEALLAVAAVHLALAGKVSAARANGRAWTQIAAVIAGQQAGRP